MISDKVSKIIHWGKDNTSNKWCKGNWMISTCKRMNLNPYLITIYIGSELSLKQDLNIKAKTNKHKQQQPQQKKQKKT